MINTLLKPTEEFIKYIDATDSIGKLKITISIYDKPIMETEDVDIHTIVDIKENVNSEYKPFGQWLYPSIFTDTENNTMFLNINLNPEKYRNKK